MSLYDQDYLNITQDDQKLLDKINAQDGILTLSQTNMKTKSIRHYETLFPNHYLDHEDLHKEEKLQTLRAEYLKEISSTFATETSIKKWIQTNKAYFIIASMLKEGYNFGHHQTYIFPEFQLGNSYQVDYLIVGKRSGGYEFLLIEMEHPNKEITTKTGELGNSFRKGLKQIEDWREYIEGRFSSLQETFLKYTNKINSLPREFTTFDASRFHYAVVAGRREDFKDYTYRQKRTYKEKQKIDLLHYDNLFDTSELVINKYY